MCIVSTRFFIKYIYIYSVHTYSHKYWHKTAQIEYCKITNKQHTIRMKTRKNNEEFVVFTFFFTLYLFSVQESSESKCNFSRFVFSYYVESKKKTYTRKSVPSSFPGWFQNVFSNVNFVFRLRIEYYLNFVNGCCTILFITKKNKKFKKQKSLIFISVHILFTSIFFYTKYVTNLMTHETRK